MEFIMIAAKNTAASQLAGMICVFVFGLFFVTAFLVATALGKQQQKQKGQEIEIDEVPDHILSTLREFFPSLLPERIAVSYRESGVPKEYLFQIQHGGEPVEIEVNVRGETQWIREIEINYESRAEYRRRSGVEEITLNDVPKSLKQLTVQAIQSVGMTVDKIHRVSKGTIFEEDAYKIEGTSGDWEFEIGILASGKPLQLEFENKKSMGEL